MAKKNNKVDKRTANIPLGKSNKKQRLVTTYLVYIS